MRPILSWAPLVPLIHFFLTTTLLLFRFPFALAPDAFGGGNLSLKGTGSCVTYFKDTARLIAKHLALSKRYDHFTSTVLENNLFVAKYVIHSSQLSSVGNKSLDRACCDHRRVKRAEEGR
jgi:hypothetical protein